MKKGLGKQLAAMALLQALTGGESLDKMVKDMLEGREDNCNCPKCKASRGELQTEYNVNMFGIINVGLEQIQKEGVHLLNILLAVTEFKDSKSPEHNINILLSGNNTNDIKTFYKNSELLTKDLGEISEAQDMFYRAFGDFMIKMRVCSDIITKNNTNPYMLETAKGIVVHIYQQMEAFKDKVEEISKLPIYKLNK